jgi:carbon-monoxide dehydrogenase small subunit
MSDRALDISLTVNGERVQERVDPRKTLVDFLREDLSLTGSHVGCEHGVCGACTVRVDGEIVRGCLMLAVQCDGAAVETIEGLSDSGEVADLQAAFEQRNALQCGFCTPGMIAAAQDLLKRAKAKKSVPSREEIREHISGNYCRCTGYHAIVDAVEAVAQARSSSSFRGAGEAREPGIQNEALDSGSGPPGRPGMTRG